MVYNTSIGSFFMLNEETLDLAKSLYKFMKKKFNFDKTPRILFKENNENAEKVLGKTGYYHPEVCEISIFITGRHPKDVLRSLAHELIHHIQVFEGKMENHHAAPASDPNYILHDKHLKEMERDAFERGNIAFREWEAYTKMGKTLEENKKKKMSKPRYKLGKKIARSLEKDQAMDAAKAHAIGFAAAKKAKKLHESVDNMENKKQNEQEVEINDVLKNSHVYNREDRKLYEDRDEQIYQEMLKKFGIKK